MVRRKKPNKAARKAAWQKSKQQRAAQLLASRSELICVLGGCCVLCLRIDELEFDHPKGRAWHPREHNQLQRMRLYWRDHAADNLRLLCSSCNGRDGALRAKWYAEQRRLLREGKDNDSGNRARTACVSAVP